MTKMVYKNRSQINIYKFIPNECFMTCLYNYGRELKNGLTIISATIMLIRISFIFHDPYFLHKDVK